MDLIAGKRCVYRGRTIPEGTRFEAQRHHGRALIFTKRAMAAPGEKGAGDTYLHRAIRDTPRRVDMQAADAPAPVPAPVSESAPDLLSPFAAFDADGDGHPGGSHAPEHSDTLKALRARYTEIVGKRPFAGWGEDVLMEKITAAIDDGDLSPAQVRAVIDTPAEDGDA